MGKRRRKQQKRQGIKQAIVCLLLVASLVPAHSQSYSFFHERNDFPSLQYGTKEGNGFRIAISLVALFTYGAKDREGIRLGGGLGISQTWNDWTFSAGIDFYRAKQRFGPGTAYGGFAYHDGTQGASYTLNRYFQGGRQVSGVLGLYREDFSVGFEDDILAYPFVGFKLYDRYRTAALEFRYRGFMLGTNVYTTDIDGVTDVSLSNSKGEYRTGKQLSSPLYLGYARYGMLVRAGLNNKIGGVLGQNSWHELFFGTPNFGQGEYCNPFFQLGVDKPYTLY